VKTMTARLRRGKHSSCGIVSSIPRHIRDQTKPATRGSRAPVITFDRITRDREITPGKGGGKKEQEWKPFLHRSVHFNNAERDPANVVPLHAKGRVFVTVFPFARTIGVSVWVLNVPMKLSPTSLSLSLSLSSNARTSALRSNRDN